MLISRGRPADCSVPIQVSCGTCERWFHCACVGISPASFRVLVRDESASYECRECRDRAAAPPPEPGSPFAARARERVVSLLGNQLFGAGGAPPAFPGAAALSLAPPGAIVPPGPVLAPPPGAAPALAPAPGVAPWPAPPGVAQIAPLGVAQIAPPGTAPPGVAPFALPVALPHPMDALRARVPPSAVADWTAAWTASGPVYIAPDRVGYDLESAVAFISAAEAAPPDGVVRTVTND